MRINVAFVLLISVFSATAASAKTITVADSYVDVVAGRLVQPARVEIDQGRILAVASSDSKQVDEGDEDRFVWLYSVTWFDRHAYALNQQSHSSWL